MSEPMGLLESHPTRKLTAHLHGELSPREAASVQAHLARCPDCRRRASEIEQVVTLARDPVLRPAPRSLGLPAVAAGSGRGWFPAAGARLAAALAAVLLLAALVVSRRPPESPRTGAAVSAPLERAAMRLHRERMLGEISFDMCDGSPDEVRTWVCRAAGLETETPAGAGSRRACASLVTAAGAPAVLVAFDSDSRPLTLLTARRRDLAAPSEWPRVPTSVLDPRTGLSLRAWADADQAFVLVAGRPGA